MTPFARLPKRTSRQFLPGHASASRFARSTTPAGTVLPGVRREERIARRSVWTNFRADQRFSFGLRDHLGLVGAALVLAIMITAAFTPSHSIFDASSRSADAPVIQAEALPAQGGSDDGQLDRGPDGVPLKG